METKLLARALDLCLPTVALMDAPPGTWREVMDYLVGNWEFPPIISGYEAFHGPLVTPYQVYHCLSLVNPLWKEMFLRGTCSGDYMYLEFTEPMFVECGFYPEMALVLSDYCRYS